MKEQGPPRLYYLTIYLVSVITLLGGVVFYSGIPWEKWSLLLVFALLTVYLQTISVKLSRRMSYSLATATIFPIIYVVGTTPAMIIAGLAGLTDGLRDKKTYERTLFNTSQLALSALIGSLAFKHLGGIINTRGFGEGLTLALGLLAYIASNLLIVTLLIALYSRRSWWSQIKRVGFGGLYSSVGTGFIGLIFTFFVMSYGFWGLVAFGALLIHLSELLKAAAEVSGERSMRRELEEELLIDEMTQVYNFRFLNEWLGDTSEEKVAVLFLDIDDFKVFNDLYGHAEGDRVLKLMCETITQSVRDNDKVIRYGGDEFVVLLPGMDGDGAHLVAQRIVANLDKLPFASWRQPITVSIGIASSPRDTVDKRQLLLMSDQAMYISKNSGKNTVRRWIPQKGPA